MLKTLLQLQCANLELSFSSTPPFPSCSGSSLWAGDECLHCSGSVCSMGQARSVRHLPQCLLCWAAQPPSPVLAEPPAALSGPDFSAKCLLEELRLVVFIHLAGAWPLALPEEERQWLHCVTKLTYPAKWICPIFTANTTVCSLSSFWMQEHLPLCLCHLCLSTAIHTEPVDLIFAKLGVLA